jgi:hypothetical protein
VTLRGVYLRLGGALLALAAGAAGVVVVVALLHSVPGPVGATTSILGSATPATSSAPTGGAIATPTDPGFPAPPPDATVLAREAGPYALALGIVPGKTRSLVRVSVVSPTGPGASGLRVSARLGTGAPVALAACGAGCYQADVATPSARNAVVSLDGRGYAFTLPSALRPPDGTQLVARATAVWKSLSSLEWHERLAGSPTEVINTVYVAVAPDELEYTIKGLSQAIIVGDHRWDRPTPTGAWVESSQLPIRMPVPFWYAVTDARTLGSATVDGRTVWRVSFFDPTTPAWFEADIDKENGRTLRLSMITASHFMSDVYGPFDAAVQLHAPPGT